jgi:hypothetical protein
MAFTQKEFNDNYYKNNKEKIKANVRAYREANLDIVKKREVEYRKTHRPEALKRAKDWAKENPEKRKAFLKDWVARNPLKSLLYHAKARARNHGREFSISEKDLTLPEVCPLLGTAFKQKDHEGKLILGTSYSLDRIDSSKGYIPGNVQVISLRANVMKNDATKEELTAFAQNILKYFGLK